MKRVAIAIVVGVMALLSRGPELIAQSLREDPADAVAYLNQIRAQVGLVPFRHNPLLDRSAGNHAAYLAANHTEGHAESPGHPGFTGAKPYERMAAVGYTATPVGENVSNGSRDARHSIDELMSAIYHRLGFLNFDLDEAGMGSAPGPEAKRIYVYNMGNSGFALAEFCKHPDSAAVLTGSGHYYEVCPTHLKIKPEAFDALQAAALRRNSRVVLWPPPQAGEVPVTFSGERPNPLPDRVMSGYPASIQFNPALVRTASLKGIRIFELPGGSGTAAAATAARKELSATRVLSAESDPNREMGPLEFALFPLDRLDWDRSYQVQAVFSVDGRDEEIAWSFRTRALGLPVYDISRGNEELPVKPGITYALRVASTPSQALLGSVQYRAPEGVNVTLDREDENTLRVSATGPLCARIHMTAGSFQFTLRLAPTDEVSGPLPAEQVFAACPEFSADFKIAAKGEELRVRPGASYRIYVEPKGSRSGIGELRFSYSANVTPKFEMVDANTVQASVAGASGGRVKVELEGGRGFSLIVDPDALGTR